MSAPPPAEPAPPLFGRLRQAYGSCGLLLPGPRGLDACVRAQLLVGQPACERGKRLAELTASQPARDEPFDRLVQLLREHSPEERPPDRRVRAEPAAHEDVV